MVLSPINRKVVKTTAGEIAILEAVFISDSAELNHAGPTEHLPLRIAIQKEIRPLDFYKDVYWSYG